MAASDQEPVPVRPKVAFLGPYTSYSHQATKSVFNEDAWELAPTVTIKEIFDVVQSGDAKAGVVPFENSSQGPVIFALEGLADRQGVYGNLIVTGEIYLDVHHFLLGRRRGQPDDDAEETSRPATAAEPGRPLADLSHITRVYSHPQALGQTAGFLAAHLPGVETVETSSTSRAAQLAAADGSGATAAVAGELAAAANGLDVLAARVEDRADNTTRFLVVFRDDADPDLLPASLYVPYADRQAADLSLEELQGLQRSMLKSLLRFTVPHDRPGALADVLDCFRTARLNLTSINSLPSLERPFRYLFFVEFEGDRPGGTDEASQRVQAAYDGIAKVAKDWKKLGTWMKQRD